MKEPLSPWMFAPIRCAAKIGFLSRYLWNNVIAHGNLSWRNEQWRILKSLGLFTNNTRYGNEDRILVLTTEGRRISKKLGVEAVMSPFADFISHDEIAAEFALRLEAEGVISSWLTEAELKRDGLSHTPISHSTFGKSKLPDLILTLAIPGETNLMAVEIEKTQKESGRYNEFVNKYKGLADIDTVIILARTQRIVEAIRRAQIRMSFPQHLRPFVFGLIDDVMKSPARALLNFDGKSVSLDGAVQTLRAKRKSDAARKAPHERRDDRFEDGRKGCL